MSSNKKLNHERGLHRLFFTGHGELDLTWFLVLLFGFMAAFGFIVEGLAGATISTAAWSFLGGAFVSALISAIPINKARILANAKSPGAISNAIASAGGNVFTDNERDPDWDTKIDHPKATPGAGKEASGS